MLSGYDEQPVSASGGSTAPPETAMFPGTGKGEKMRSDYRIVSRLLDKSTYPPFPAMSLFFRRRCNRNFYVEGTVLRNSVLVLTCILLLAGAAGCGNSSSTEEIFVFAGAGTKPALDEAAVLFEQNTGTKVAVNYGGGGEVLSSMVLGKTGDVYIAPEQRFMDSARKQGAIDTDTTIYSIAYMVPVIGVQEGNPLNIQSLADLARPGIEIALCNPETTAVGNIAPQILQKAGLYDAVQPNIVITAPQVTSVVTMLEMEQVDAGFIWHHFETTNADDVDIIWIPKEYVTGIGEIQAAVSAYSRQVQAAQKFIDFLVSAEGKEIFEKNGYFTDAGEVSELWQGKT
jgi:molybdate transport system substrate-binding protein